MECWSNGATRNEIKVPSACFALSAVKFFSRLVVAWGLGGNPNLPAMHGRINLFRRDGEVPDSHTDGILNGVRYGRRYR